MSDLIHVILLGIIEGITEFLPISSTGHLLIAEKLGLGHRSDLFNVGIQAGAILATTRFRSRDDLQTTIERYVKLYNDHLPQRALGHQTPRQAVQAWRAKQPELFVRKLKNQAGLDKS